MNIKPDVFNDTFKKAIVNIFQGHSERVRNRLTPNYHNALDHFQTDSLQTETDCSKVLKTQLTKKVTEYLDNQHSKVGWKWGERTNTDILNEYLVLSDGVTFAYNSKKRGDTIRIKIGAESIGQWTLYLDTRVDESINATKIKTLPREIVFMDGNKRWKFSSKDIGGKYSEERVYFGNYDYPPFDHNLYFTIVVTKDKKLKIDLDSVYYGLTENERKDMLQATPRKHFPGKVIFPQLRRLGDVTVGDLSFYVTKKGTTIRRSLLPPEYNMYPEALPTKYTDSGRVQKLLKAFYYHNDPYTIREVKQILPHISNKVAGDISRQTKSPTSSTLDLDDIINLIPKRIPLFQGISNWWAGATRTAPKKTS
jgi:hypothetical protein